MDYYACVLCVSKICADTKESRFRRIFHLFWAQVYSGVEISRRELKNAFRYYIWIIK